MNSVRRILEAGRSMAALAHSVVTSPRETAAAVKRNYDEELDKAKGKAVSRARMILGARFIPEVLKHLQPYRRAAKVGFRRRPKGRGPFIARPIAGARIRMLDGRVYDFYTDGSLRHAFGRRIGKLSRKAAKRVRRGMTAQIGETRHATV